ncbi:hypothetical protein KU616_24005, partial [Salmonella enterica subsp. enterica serovar Mbandaka]|nr:hypothetical protein [Salmonella enterica subsp. enterica serovar Mbandaka]
ERGYLADVELAKIGSFEAALLAYVDRDHAPLMQEINQSGGYNACHYRLIDFAIQLHFA